MYFNLIKVDDINEYESVMNDNEEINFKKSLVFDSYSNFYGFLSDRIDKFNPQILHSLDQNLMSIKNKGFQVILFNSYFFYKKNILKIKF